MTGEAAPEQRVLAERYRLLSRIDRGGAGEVWLARDLRLDREVAVKLLGPEADAAFRERFANEARRAASVTHPNVVTVFDEGQDGDDAYMVMEYIRGRTLRDLIAERGPLPPHEAARLVEQVAAGLDAAHAAGVLHLDLKPANVILSHDGIAKLADFGVAVAARGEAERELIGTARYVAPERIEGAAPTARSDVYGLGLVAYELLAGRPAFEGVDTDDLLRLRLEGAAPSLRRARIGVAPELDLVVAKALAREPRDRYATAGAFAAALRATAERGDRTAPLGMVVPPRPLSAARGAGMFGGFRLPRLDSTIALIAMALVLAAVVSLFLTFGSVSPGVAPASVTPTPAASLTTPNVVGQDLNKGMDTLIKAGFGRAEFDVAAGTNGKPCSIARQEPTAGSSFQRGQTARVFYVAGRDCRKKNDD